MSDPLEITIKFNKLHDGQKRLESGALRFNVICCGRRFGKTEYGIERVIMPALEGYPAAWFAPSYRMLKEVWDKSLMMLEPLLSSKNSQERSLSLITGGKIDFWSLDDPRYVRGRKYKHLVIDEAAHVRGLKDAWTKIMRPLLADYQGTADFLSTPNGKQNYFFELFGRDGAMDNWASFQMPTASNPHILAEEIEAARLELDALTFAQEYLAEFVDFVSMPFAYCFKPEKHIGNAVFDPKLPLLLSFDFGVDPMPCVALQVNHFPKSVTVLREFHIFDGDIYRLLTQVKAWIASLPYKPILKVTGDPSGRARSPLAEGAGNAFQAIISELGIRKDMVVVPRRFSIQNSRTLLNSVLEHIPFTVNPACELLIKDLKFVECERDGEGKIRLKKTGKNASAGASNETMTHLLDAMRYAMHLEFSDFAAKFAKEVSEEEEG